MRSTNAAPDLKVMPITVTAQAVSKLRNAILSGVFSPGERLLEQSLCEWIGVSRTSIREALRRLEAERLITITPNRGPSVTEIDWEEANSIYDVRALLEGEATALFAASSSRAQLEEMKLALADFERAVAINNPIERLDSTERFYGVILAGCGNPIIKEIIQGLVARINFLRARSMSQEGRSRQSAVEMWHIYDAIEKRRPEQARKAAINHIEAAKGAAHETYIQDRSNGTPTETKEEVRQKLVRRTSKTRASRGAKAR